MAGFSAPQARAGKHHGADGTGNWLGERPVRRRSVAVNALAVLTLVLAVVAVATRATPAASAPSTTFKINVNDIDTRAAISKFQFLINVDNTGMNAQRSPAPGTGCSTQDAGYPTSCAWTSMGIHSASPIYTQGDETQLAAALASFTARGHNGRYLISVLADGYKLDGTHFTVPSPGDVDVLLHATASGAANANGAGLPAATIQTAVFEDNSSTNGAPDLPAEHGLAGFKGQIGDYLGQVITDLFGNPMCTTYQYGPDGKPVLDGGGAPIIVMTGGTCLSRCYVVDNGKDIGIVAPLTAAASGEAWADGGDYGRCPNDVTGLVFKDVLIDAVGRAPGSAVPATAVIEGKLKIPNVGPNRYALSVIPPNGSSFIQTTTLEGDHDWDAWVMEGATGLDTEFVQGGEPFPGIIFGYVHATCGAPGADPANCNRQAPMASGTGTIKGTIDAVKVYYPPKGGTNQSGLIFGGLQGAKVDKPITDGWVSLTDLNRGDAAVYTAKANPDGTFAITGIPAGDYSLTWWDEAQTHILDLQNVTVTEGATQDLGILPLNGWWTGLSGYVYNDLNRNGVKDPGEPGVRGYTLTTRKRENSLMDRGGTTATTDANGFYEFKNAYPMTQWLVLEAYNDRFYTTGVTYQADNAPAATHLADRDTAGNFVGSGVDISFLPIIGLSGTVDWGIHAYDPLGTSGGIDPRNGGIVGTVSYDTTRNELDPRYAVVEDWQPGIPGATVNLYAPVACGTTAGSPCDTANKYELNVDGSMKHGNLLNNYTTEEWQQPTSGAANTDCVARDINGAPLVHGTDEQVLPDPTKSGNDTPCLEGPLVGIQFQNGFSNVNGNYGFADGCQGASAFDPASLDGKCLDGSPPTKLTAPFDYIVEPVIPTDVAGIAPAYKVTTEEDINIANGDNFVPAVPPPACVGALHTVDVKTLGTDGWPSPTNAAALPAGVTVPASTPIDNPGLVSIGGSPYEGQAKPYCNQKLVSLNNGKSIVPTFNWWTPVQIPTRFWGLAVDDLQFSGNPKSLTFGEKQGISFAPVGIYDYSDHLEYTTESDYNGLFDVLLPSTNRISCPTPSGVCANVYRFVGNDPGTPGRLNLNYKPGYRTIAAEFEALPGLIVPADLAPTQIGVNVQLPGGQIDQVACAVETTRPQIFTVSRPLAYLGGSAANIASRTISVKGIGFGATTGTVKLDNTVVTTSAWSDTGFTFAVPTTAALAGKRQLSVTAVSGLTTRNGLTFHVIGGDYTPTVREVGPASANRMFATNPRYVPASVAATLGANPPTADHAIQHAIDDARSTFNNNNPNPDLIVVYPGLTDANPRNNPRGAYFENLIVAKPVSIQGVGPGGTYADGTTVQGAIVDGSAFAGDSPVATDWDTKVGNLTWQGNQTVNDGAVVTLYAPQTNTYSAGVPPLIDGLDIRGADQQGFPGNINAIGGAKTGLPAGIVTQGGAVFANAYVHNLAVTNNVVENNGGGYGNIRIGTPELTGDRSSHNDGVKILHNRIIHNAGTNLAGGIGFFYGSDGYEVANNDICGNFSAEYGGGVSVYGLSAGGSIHDNKIRFSQSYDEGGGVMIAGELSTNPAIASTGAGAQNIYDNLIQANMANDDGGGIRFLQPGNFPMNVYNNMLVNNVSTHEGGGIALDDAPNVRFYNNTVMKNITTATAVTSNGQPAPAGLSTGTNSTPLQATLPAGSPGYSNPLMFNNIFWDNRAGTQVGGAVAGIGATGDATPINYWDMGSVDGIQLSPTNSLLQSETVNHNDVTASSTNKVDQDPQVLLPYDVGLTFNIWRNNPQFTGAILVVADQAATDGDYHLNSASPAINAGAASKAVPTYQAPPATLTAPTTDIDLDPRPAGGGFDAGADEIRATPGTTDLSITKDDGVTAANIGDVLTYKIVVTNNGPANVGGAMVNDTVHPGLTNLSWTCAGVVATSCTTASGTGNITNRLVSLNAAESATFTLTATVNGANPTNTATVAAPTGITETNGANNSATDTDTVSADLAITKTDNLSSVSRGGAVRYTIVASNNGPSAVNGAVVFDNFPPLGGGITWTCTAAGGATCVPATPNASFNGIGTINRAVNIPVGATVTFTSTNGAVPAGTNATTLTNTATVTAPAGYVEINPINNSATDTDTINGLHVSAVSGVKAVLSAAQWQALVTVTVHDATHLPVVGATVTVGWVAGGNGGTSCVTLASGQCTVTRTAISRTNVAGSAAIATVANVGRAPDGYQPTRNEGGLLATVTVTRP